VYTVRKENYVSLTPIKIRFYQNKRALGEPYRVLAI